jgi:Ca-activated chloride channel family protein
VGRILAALGVVAVAWVVSGDTRTTAASAESAQEQTRPTFSTRSELVVLHVVVKDGRGSYVTGLDTDAFTVREDGRLQEIRFFGVEDAPVTVGLIVDGSGSMLPLRDRVLAAVTSFVDTSNPNDDIFALVFNDYVTAALPAHSPFTSSAYILEAALGRIFAPRGRTALHDAIAAGLEYVERGRHAGKVLVVVSDGGDNASTTPFAEILRAAQTANTVIYSIAFVDPLEHEVSPKHLKQLASVSGGEAFQPRDKTGVESALRNIARDVRNTYTIGYVPDDLARGDRFRRLRVDVRVPNLRGLRVRSRDGYVLGDP